VTELSVLFVTYNSWRLCADAIDSLLAGPPRRADGGPMPFEVVVVDNASPQRDPAGEARLEARLTQCNGRLVRSPVNGGYAAGMNLAARHATGARWLICNPDVLFQPECIDRLLRAQEREPRIGAVAPEGYWDRDCEIRLPPNILPTLGDLLRFTLAGLGAGFGRAYSTRRTRRALPVWAAGRDVELEMLSGCCFLIARDVVARIGGLFDERFPLYFEDTDLSMRLRRAGLRLVQVDGARIVHLYNKSGATDHALAMERYWISRDRWYRKWWGRRGGWLHAWSRRALRGRRAAARAAVGPWPWVRDFGTSRERVRIDLPEPCARFLVEIALDPNFYLAAAAFGGGASWSPGDAAWEGFAPGVPFFFHVCDLSRGRPRSLGVWRHVRAPFPAAVPAAAPQTAP
jgi:GT2 family glycosyltransferase